VSQFAQIVVNALLLTGILALVALGFSLVWGIMNIVNLAHGAYIVLGAYTTFYLHELAGIDPFLSIPISMVVMFAIGYGIQRALINQIVRAPMLVTFLLTFGLQILIVNLVNYFCKADSRSVTMDYSGTGFTLGEIRVPYIRLAALAISLLLVLATAWFLKASRAGRAIRATGMDIDAARLTGVDVASIYGLTYAIGAALAGAAGSLLSVIVPFDPGFGQNYMFWAFAISVVGGLGAVSNVLLGATVMAFVNVFVGTRIPQLSQAFTFTVLVILLVVRPRGLAGKKFYA
jgi:branched-chain amino acid transport system permease protein